APHAQDRRDMGLRLGPPHFVAIGVVGALALLVGIVAGVVERYSGSYSGPYLPAGCQLWLVEGAHDEGSCPRQEELPPLRELAEARQIRLGSAVNVDALRDREYREILGREFNAVTPETAMKWSTVEPR